MIHIYKNINNNLYKIKKILKLLNKLDNKIINKIKYKNYLKGSGKKGSGKNPTNNGKNIVGVKSSGNTANDKSKKNNISIVRDMKTYTLSIVKPFPQLIYNEELDCYIPDEYNIQFSSIPNEHNIKKFIKGKYKKSQNILYYELEKSDYFSNYIYIVYRVNELYNIKLNYDELNYDESPKVILHIIPEDNKPISYAIINNHIYDYINDFDNLDNINGYSRFYLDNLIPSDKIFEEKTLKYMKSIDSNLTKDDIEKSENKLIVYNLIMKNIKYEKILEVMTLNFYYYFKYFNKLLDIIKIYIEILNSNLIKKYKGIFGELNDLIDDHNELKELFQKPINKTLLNKFVYIDNFKSYNKFLDELKVCFNIQKEYTFDKSKDITQLSEIVNENKKFSDILKTDFSYIYNLCIIKEPVDINDIKKFLDKDIYELIYKYMKIKNYNKNINDKMTDIHKYIDNIINIIKKLFQIQIKDINCSSILNKYIKSYNDILKILLSFDRLNKYFKINESFSEYNFDNIIFYINKCLETYSKIYHNDSDFSKIIRAAGETPPPKSIILIKKDDNKHNEDLLHILLKNNYNDKHKAQIIDSFHKNIEHTETNVNKDIVARKHLPLNKIVNDILNALRFNL